MTENEFSALILNNLHHIPTSGQRELSELIAKFIFSRAEPGQRLTFLLRGYAGTGKTSMISSLVRSLPMLGKKTVLLAPTGRAAKVLSQYSGKPASTIHRKIYMHRIPPTNYIYNFCGDSCRFCGSKSVSLLAG
jgi:exodeoxyribonuclease V